MKKSNFSSYPYMPKTFSLDFLPIDSIQKWNQLHIRDQLTETNRLIYLISIFDKQLRIWKCLAFWIWTYLPNTLPRGSKILARGVIRPCWFIIWSQKKKKEKLRGGHFLGSLGVIFGSFWKKTIPKWSSLYCASNGRGSFFSSNEWVHRFSSIRKKQ